MPAYPRLPRGTLISKTSLRSSLIWQEVGEERTKQDQADKLKGVHCSFSSKFSASLKTEKFDVSQTEQKPRASECVNSLG